MFKKIECDWNSSKNDNEVQKEGSKVPQTGFFYFFHNVDTFVMTCNWNFQNMQIQVLSNI